MGCINGAAAEQCEDMFNVRVREAHFNDPLRTLARDVCLFLNARAITRGALAIISREGASKNLSLSQHLHRSRNERRRVCRSN
jgi:hypothetical protein